MACDMENYYGMFLMSKDEPSKVPPSMYFKTALQNGLRPYQCLIKHQSALPRNVSALEKPKIVQGQDFESTILKYAVSSGGGWGTTDW